VKLIIVWFRVVVQCFPPSGFLRVSRIFFGINKEFLEVTEVVSLIQGGFLAHLLLGLIGTASSMRLLLLMVYTYYVVEILAL